MESEGNLYDKKLKDLEKELRNLKTAHFKTSTTISTMQKEASIELDLVLDNDVHSDKRAIVELETVDNTEMISACYIKNMDISDIEDGRFISIQRINSDVGKVKYEIIVLSTSYDDFITLDGGGSVKLNYDLVLIGSSGFNVKISYRNFFGGSE